MRVLIAFECSGVVRDAFAALGHDAWSCDLQPCELPGQHLECDALGVISGSHWDLIIAHPPCTALCVSGNGTYTNSYPRMQAIVRTVALWESMIGICDRVCMENPVGVLSSAWRKPAQYIQPYQYGDDASKRTGLWLKGLPKLRPSKFVEPDENGRWANQTLSGQNKLGPSPERAALRAKTYAGIAAAMAKQWS